MFHLIQNSSVIRHVISLNYSSKILIVPLGLRPYIITILYIIIIIIYCLNQ